MSGQETEPEYQPVSGALAEILESVRAAERAAADRFAARSQECPACSWGSESERACPDRGVEDSGFLCRWVAPIALERHHAEIRSRLLVADAPERVRAQLQAALERGAVRASPAWQSMQDYVRQAGSWSPGSVRTAVLGGPRDSGKTFAALWALGQRGGRFIPSARLGRPVDGESWERWLRSPCVVLDDVGVDHGTAWWRAQFTELVVTRHDRGLDLVLTVNLREREFVEAVLLGDERLSSRLKKFVNCQGFEGGR